MHRSLLPILVALALAGACQTSTTSGELPGAGDGDGDGDGDAGAGECGDGLRGDDEGCDDGNLTAGDGCDDACALETDHACPVPGEPCVLIAICGNDRIEGSETCDDGDLDPGDGCSDLCRLEDGWSCPRAGVACVASRCGDGLVAGFETCDDGDVATGDGCDDRCKLEEGFHCPVPGAACEPTACGDGAVEGTEECDDQNLAVGDGCTPFCRREPSCADGVCLAVCGDQVVQDTEACDDGNQLTGDGCDAGCRIETGFECVETPLADPVEVAIPVTIRDFIAACGDGSRLADDQGGAAPYGHRDFECFNNGLETGMVEPLLDAGGKPVRVDNQSTYSNESFAQWYRTDLDYNRPIAQELVLPAIGGGAYRLDSSSLFPINDDGFVVEDCNGSPCEQRHRDGDDSGDMNFHFTTEVRFWFEYKGDEVLAFSGDDDVWVFINDRLAVDIGGVHGRQNGSVDLGDAQVASDLGLTVGGTYEAVVFHAERHTTRSQYRLTLTNFTRAPSTCADQCGDGTVSSREVCDDGAGNGDGDGSVYGGCAADCTLEPYCGDAVVDTEHGEICDDGINLGGDASECAPGCRSLGASCGDGVVQTEAGEQCDDGNQSPGDGCSAECLIEID